MKLSLQVSNQALSSYWGWFFTWGILLLILGITAVSAATLTTLISVIFIGFLITLSGAIIFVDTFTFWWKKWTGFFIHLIMSLLYLIAGLMLINNPALGSTTLTLLLGIFYIFVGVSRVTYSLSFKIRRWQWSFLNGFISLLLGILIITNLPSASLFIIGLFVGIDLIFCGFAYIMTALAARKRV